MEETAGLLDPLELALRLEAAEDLSGLDHDETPPVDEENDNDGEDDQKRLSQSRV